MNGAKKGFGVIGVRAASLRAAMVIILSFGLFACAKKSPAGFTFAQWNIGHFAHGASDVPTAEYSDENAWAEVIKELDADVLGLCEYNAVMCDQRRTAEVLGREFRDHHEGPLDFYNCNAIWVKGDNRFRFIACENRYFSWRCQGRYWIDCTYLVDGRKVHFVETHLDWDQDDKGRICRFAQIAELIEFYRNEKYVVLSGDFNVESGPEEWGLFAWAGWTFANSDLRREAVATYRKNDDSTFERALDNIIVKGFNVSEVRFAGEDYRLSDHRPLVCRLDFRD